MFLSLYYSALLCIFRQFGTNKKTWSGFFLYHYFKGNNTRDKHVQRKKKPPRKKLKSFIIDFIYLNYIYSFTLCADAIGVQNPFLMLSNCASCLRFNRIVCNTRANLSNSLHYLLQFKNIIEKIADKKIQVISRFVNSPWAMWRADERIEQKDFCR